MSAQQQTGTLEKPLEQNSGEERFIFSDNKHTWAGQAGFAWSQASHAVAALPSGAAVQRIGLWQLIGMYQTGS
jgi:hypothetical protein